jgi:hypothetical protein
MLPLLVALGLVAGIVDLAAGQAEDPSIRRFLQERRLEAILRKPESQVTLPEAEDGLAIARYLNKKELHAKFARMVASKKQRARRPHP